MSLNTVTLVGRVGRDPEVKYFESGTVKASVTLAVNRNKRDSDPDWFELEFWGKTAQTAADYVRKGSLIGLTGTLRFDYWQDRNTGLDRSKPIIRVDRFEFLGSKRDQEAAATDSAYNNDEF